MADGPEGGFDREGKNDDFYQNQNESNYESFNEETGMMQGGGGNSTCPPSFRGRGAWRGGMGGGNRGRGSNFDRGMPPRGFRGGGGGFMNRGRFRGPGPGHHHDMGGFMNRGRFRPPGPGHDMGGNWNNNGPPHSVMGGMGGPKNNADNENIWAEARSPDGKTYYYHTQTRETTWDRPEGPGVRIVRHEEWSTNMTNKPQNIENSGFPGGPKGPDQQQHHGQPPPQQQQQNFPTQGPPPFNLQVPPPGQGSQPMSMPPPQLQGPPMQGLPSQLQGPPPGTLLPNQPNQSSPARPMLSSGPPGQDTSDVPGPTFPGGSPGQFRHRAPSGFPGVENGLNSSGAPGVDTTPKPSEGPPPNMSQMPPPLGGPLGGGMPPPPFSPFGGPPPFGMPPAGIPPGFPPPGNFALVPPPWGIPGIPSGVPPPVMAVEQLALSQIDPKIIAKAYEWSEHTSPDGKAYYFNSKTQNSVWEKPAAVVEFEAAKLVAQQRLTAPPGFNPPVQQFPPQQLGSSVPTKEKVVSDKTESSIAGGESKEKKSSAGEKCRPVSSTPVPGTPWCVVWTGDKRVFFYNPSNKMSVWEKPQELIGRYDVEELLKSCPEAGKSKDSAKVKKAEATSTTSPLSDADKLAKENGALTTGLAGAAVNTTPGSKIEGGKSQSDDKDESSDKEPPAKRSKRDSTDKTEVITIGEETEGKDDEMTLVKEGETEMMSSKSSDSGEKVKIETKDGFKEMTPLEAEVKAARERAIIPLEVRLKKFREMLIEKQVSAFSTWEKELHKIVFDPRYLYLTSRERKSTFEAFVKERAEEERKEKKKHMKQVKEQFLKFLEQINVSSKTTYIEFQQKYGRDERYKNVEKARDREQYFGEYISELKKRDKEERASKKERAKEELQSQLRERIKDYHIKWPEAKKKLELDFRFDVLESEEKEDIFRIFQKKLKYETKAKEKRKKKEKKEKEKERKAKEKREKKAKEDQDGNDLILPIENVDSADEEDTVKSDEAKDDQEKSSDGKVEDIISEEEEGCITDDSDDDVRLEREKKERAEVSMRKREREVQRTLANHLRDRDKEREFYMHEEAVQEFQALLTDLVRNVDMSWKEAKKLIKKDRRWASVSILSRDEMEDLFNQHCDNISRKKRLRFRELLEESRVKLTSTWKEVKKRIKDDPRYMKFSSSERKCEREFELYLKDMAASMKADFRNLLKETKMLSNKTKQQIREQPSVMKDIGSLLSKDKRYLQLDGMPDERERLLLEYLDDLERKGPLPPPTASEPSRRLKAA